VGVETMGTRDGVSACAIIARVLTSAIQGVKIVPLAMHRDGRGHVTELFAFGWPELAGFAPRQWHALASRAGAMRGMHAHARHDDLKIVLSGEIALALRDLRRGSTTDGVAELLALSGETYVGVVIPAGVAHGILALTEALVLVGVTATYDPSDELECAWDDPELGIEWPEAPTILSERDVRAGSLAELVAALEERRSSFSHSASR
jgi:dTDP-4-dehydrorhamnose 3,5-epimerase